MAHPNNEADKMLDVYIYDYFMKKKLSASAKAFQAEAGVPANRKAIDAPGGFLFEWWSVFWDVFIARYKRPRPDTTGSNNTVQSVKRHEQQHQEDMRQQLQQMQQLIRQKHIEEQQQQEQSNEAQVQNATANVFRRKNLGSTHDSAIRIRDRSSKPRHQKDLLAMANMKITDQNHAAGAESVAIRNRLPDPGQALHDIPAGNLLASNPMNEQCHQRPVPQDLRNLMNPLLNLSSPNSDGSLYGITGPNRGVNILPLKGWPLMGLDRLQAGLLQQQTSLMHTSQQIQMQQQLEMLLNLQMNTNFLQDIDSNSGRSIVPNHDLQVQVGLPISSRGDAEVLAKASNSCITGKRKQPMSSSGPTNSSETAKRRSLPTDSAPSTPSTHTTDVTAMPTLNHDDSARPHTCDNDSLSASTSVQNQLAPMGDPLNTRSSDDNGKFLSHDRKSAQCLDAKNDFTFSQIGRIHVMPFNCFDLSSNGKIIATGGLDKKVVLCYTSFREPKYMNEEHSNAITDIRFGHRLPRMATSSLDKTVKIWDVDNSGNSVRTFIGHSAPVMSVDFHPNKDDLVCSCDDVSAIRYWSIRDNGCAGVSKGGATQVRFQPNHGRRIAAVVGTGVSVIDTETTQTCSYTIKGHTSKVQSVCWSASGEYLASLNEDVVKVWKIGSGEKQECIHELSITGKKFHCCIFHPSDPSLMIIGLEQSLDLWNMAENKIMTVLGETTTAVAMSRHVGLVASASEDNSVRLWK